MRGWRDQMNVDKIEIIIIIYILMTLDKEKAFKGREERCPLYIVSEFTARNAELAKPMMRLRADIAGRWKRIAELLRFFEIKESKKLTSKILKVKATTDHMREEIYRILSFDFPDIPEVDELVSLLTKTDEDISKIQGQRDTLFALNSAIIGSFFQTEKYAGYYRRIPYLERLKIVEDGLLRACDTFNPEEGELSTYAFLWMKAYVQKIGKLMTQNKEVSLNQKNKDSRSDDTTDLLATIEDNRYQQPDEAGEQCERAMMLRQIVEEMPIEYRRAMELVCGLGDSVATYSQQQAAKIMNAEGLRTVKGKEFSPANLQKYVEGAKQQIAQKMKHLFAD